MTAIILMIRLLLLARHPVTDSTRTGLLRALTSLQLPRAMFAAALRLLVVAVGLIPAVPALGADDPAAPIPKPQVNVGDRWLYREMNYLTNSERSVYQVDTTFVGPDVILTVNTFPKIKNKDLERDAHWTAEWNARATPSGGIYEPNTGLLKFPLKIGATYETKYELSALRGSTARTKLEATVKVTGWEDVVVPAGKFRALKVEARGTFQRLDSGRKGWTKYDIWYVPEVKRWAKFIYEDGDAAPYVREGQELIEFNPR
jgi:hypothetical protein